MEETANPQSKVLGGASCGFAWIGCILENGQNKKKVDKLATMDYDERQKIFRNVTGQVGHARSIGSRLRSQWSGDPGAAACSPEGNTPARERELPINSAGVAPST